MGGQAIFDTVVRGSLNMSGGPPNASTVPSYPNTPPRSKVRPPVDTRAQELPFGELAWEDFERLCLRLARHEGDVLHCQLYGTRGRNQEGIDIYARLKGPATYRVYQCKREVNFGASKIRRAVAKFLDGGWAAKSTSFVLCTKESLVETTRADELEAQRKVLEQRGVDLVVWDSGQLSSLLKARPLLVDDFFGRSWVRAFMGEEAASSLAYRLDAAEVGTFRLRLGQLYARVFGTHDPGLPVPLVGPIASLPLHQRYVLADLVESRPRESALFTQVSDHSSAEPLDSSDSPTESLDGRRSRLPSSDEPLLERVSLEGWLGDGTNFLVLGGPGSGKSSLLRFVAVDLLDDAPFLQSLSAKWGEQLPVWISFPYWTRLIASEGQDVCSVSKLLQIWLRSLDEERLWPLVERALGDDRLLLLVDGLDEWASVMSRKFARKPS